MAADLKKKRTFRTFSYRGVELEKLLDMNNEDVRASSHMVLLFLLIITFGCSSLTYVLAYQIDVDAKFNVAQLVHARARRRFQRGLKRRPMGLIKKLRKAKKEALPNEKPAVVKTHLRDMIIVPEMIGSVVGIYNGKVGARMVGSVNLTMLRLQVFNSVEIKPEMTGHYLGEFSCSYRPVKHGRPGVSFFLF